MNPEVGIGSRYTLKLLVVSVVAGSKRSPFFQIFNAMAAILRARVRRAIGGLHPSGNESLVELLKRPRDRHGANGRTLEDR